MRLLGTEETRAVKILALAVAAVLGAIVSAWVLGVAERSWAEHDDALAVVITIGGAVSAPLVLWILPAAFRIALQFWSFFINLDSRLGRFVLAEMYAIVGSLAWAIAIVNILGRHRVAVP